MNVSLPEDYKQFLLVTNGGAPTPSRIDIPETPHTQMVAWLYGLLKERDAFDLEYEQRFLQIRMDKPLPPGLILIGHDPGANLLLLGTKGDTRGKVYFWDVVGLMETTTPEENTYCVADSFTDFLNALHDRRRLDSPK